MVDGEAREAQARARAQGMQRGARVEWGGETSVGFGGSSLQCYAAGCEGDGVDAWPFILVLVKQE